MSEALNNPNQASEKQSKLKEVMTQVHTSLSSLRAEITKGQEAQKQTKEQAVKTVQAAAPEALKRFTDAFNTAQLNLKDNQNWIKMEQSLMTQVDIANLANLNLENAQKQLATLATELNSVMPPASPTTVFDNFNTMLSKIANSPQVAPILQGFERFGISAASAISMLFNAARTAFIGYMASKELPPMFRAFQDKMREQAAIGQWRILLEQRAGAIPVASLTPGAPVSTLDYERTLSIPAGSRDRYVQCYKTMLEVRAAVSSRQPPVSVTEPTIDNAQTENTTKAYIDALDALKANRPAPNEQFGGITIPTTGREVKENEKVTFKYDATDIEFTKTANTFKVKVGDDQAPVTIGIESGNVQKVKLLRPVTGNDAGDVRIQVNEQDTLHVKIREIFPIINDDRDAAASTAGRLRKPTLTIKNGTAVLED